MSLFNREALIKQLRAMCKAHEVSVEFTPAGGPAHTAVLGFLGQKKVGERMIDAGAQADIRFSVYTVSDDWSTRPAKGDKVTIGGVTYRVVAGQDYLGGLFWRMDCGDEFQ